jgi:hypothetical protein
METENTVRTLCKSLLLLGFLRIAADLERDLLGLGTMRNLYG